MTHMNNFPETEIKIHQALFGYRDGHHLLASSVKLDKEETQLMERLSDGPGMDIPPAFDGYLTGYALPTSPYYAIGKTWSAKELPRPGCVWTHALLIPKDIPLTQIRDKITESLFSRPDTQRINWRKSYQCPVTLFEEYSLDSEATRRDACRVLAWMMEGDAVLVISDRLGRFHDALLFLLFYAGTLLWEDFSFSTFSRTFRKISPQEPFHLQIAPRAFQPILQRQFSGNPVFDITPGSGKHIFQEDALDAVQFALSFAAEKEFHSMNLKKLRIVRDIFSSCLKSAIDRLNDIKAAFSDSPDEQEALLSEVVCRSLDSYLLGGDGDFSNLLELCTTNQIDFSGSDDALSQALKKLTFVDDELVCRLLNQLFRQKKLNHFGVRLLSALCQNLTENGARAFLKEYPEKISSLIYMNPKLTTLDCVWKQSANVQSDALNAIRTLREGQRKNYPLSEQEELRALSKLYENSEEDFALLVFQIFSNQSVTAFFHWSVTAQNKAQIRRWSSVCAFASPSLVVRELQSCTDSTVFLAVIDALDSYNPSLQAISSITWEQFYQRFCQNEEHQKARESYAMFLLPVILQGQDRAFPKSLSSFALKEVHHILSVNNPGMPWDKWARLSELLPPAESEHLEWDKCARLRKVAQERFGLKIPVDYSNSNNHQD